MNPAIRREFLDALHRAMGALDYAVIGGSALAEYGHTRATADVDVMVPAAISEVAENQLVENGIVQTERGGLGYVHLRPKFRRVEADRRQLHRVGWSLLWPRYHVGPGCKPASSRPQ
jgi:hypothetical protein